MKWRLASEKTPEPFLDLPLRIAGQPQIQMGHYDNLNHRFTIKSLVGEYFKLYQVVWLDETESSEPDQNMLWDEVRALIFNYRDYGQQGARDAAKLFTLTRK